jgi:ribosomal subunit interface protein
MKILLKATGFDLTPSLEAYVNEKLGPMARYVKRIDEEGAAELRVEVARTTRHHRHGEVFMAEANLRLPKRMLRAVHDDVDVRIAVTRLKEKLRLEIDKYKTQHDARRFARRRRKS